jgi:hypothetical protein
MKTKTTILRCAMIAAVATVCLQSTMTQKAEAIAGAGTSSGEVCFEECFEETLTCLRQTLSRYDHRCIPFSGYCHFNCVEYGRPFRVWWIFTR